MSETSRTGRLVPRTQHVPPLVLLVILMWPQSPRRLAAETLVHPTIRSTSAATCAAAPASVTNPGSNACAQMISRDLKWVRPYSISRFCSKNDAFAGLFLILLECLSSLIAQKHLLRAAPWLYLDTAGSHQDRDATPTSHLRSPETITITMDADVHGGSAMKHAPLETGF